MSLPRSTKRPHLAARDQPQAQTGKAGNGRDLSGLGGRHQRPAADRHGGDADPGAIGRPQGEHVGHAAFGGNADLLAVEVFHRRDGGLAVGEDVPAGRPLGERRHHLGFRAFADGERGAGAEVTDDVGGAGVHGLLGGRAAAVDRDFDLEIGVLIIAELFGGAEQRIERIVGRRQAEPDHVLGVRRGCAG